MTRPLLPTFALAAVTLAATGCCTMDPYTGQAQCREGLTGLTVGWQGVGGQCSGTLFDRRQGILRDCQGRSGLFGYGRPQCGVGQGAYGTYGGYGLGHGFGQPTYGQPSYGQPSFAPHGGAWAPGCNDCGVNWGSPYGGTVLPSAPVVTPMQSGFQTPVIQGTTLPPSHLMQSPILSQPVAPPQYVSPLTPPPRAFPTSVSPTPAAGNPPVIQNTYSWRTHARRS